MNMHLIDWAIVGGLLVFMVYAACGTKKYTTTVADFLAANRCAKRYLLAVSDGIAGLGAITIVGTFEVYYHAGFVFSWWEMLFSPIVLVVIYSGWVVSRYRETRALTLAQFLEARYSKRFRVFAGIVVFASGTLNFGLFPAVGARFFMYFCGLPSIPVPVGPLTIDLMYAMIIIFLLGIALLFTFLGGQIAVIVTDFIQGSFFNIMICVIIGFLLYKIPWVQLIETLSDRPPDESMLHPFQSLKTKDFNLTFTLIGVFSTIYSVRAWQGNGGYFVSARNAHEARMGGVFGSFRTGTQSLMVRFLPIFAYVLMHNINWTAQAANATQVLDSIGSGTIRTQLTTTVALTQILPVGLIGGFCAVMLAAFISTHDTYLHSFGSIFIQDVYMPLRKKPLDNKEHMSLLKKSIFGVALFIFLFSLLFPQNTYIFMFFAITGALWVGGAGAVIIGGLYWKRGTTAAAFSAVSLAILITLFGFVASRFEGFPLNMQHVAGIAMGLCSITYIMVSLLGKRHVHNMDKLLHRGKYAVVDDDSAVVKEQTTGWRKRLGINSSFTRGDTIIYLCLGGWALLGSAWAIFWTTYNLVFGASIEAWAMYWKYYVWSGFILALITTVWFTIGGLLNLKEMFHRLATMARDEHDDGTVVKGSDDEIQE